MSALAELGWRLVIEAWVTIVDLAPILALLAVFQLVFLRKPIPGLRRILAGVIWLAIGLTLFRVGLSTSLVPMGADLARALVDGGSGLALLAFAALLGFTAALIEPTLVATADRVRDLTGGAVRPFALRIVVAFGIGFGLLLGALRIVHGLPLAWLILALVVTIAIFVRLTPKPVVPLALDSGGVATSAVTVPLIAAYGVAVAEALPGRSPLADGFGLVVLALLSAAASVLVFFAAQTWYRTRRGSGV